MKMTLSTLGNFWILKILSVPLFLSLVSCVGDNGESSVPAITNSLPFELPDHIIQITTFGQRADWSHDGKKILFIEKTFGDVYEVSIETRELKPLTHHYYHEGYVRALYLSNGDILLSGARKFDAENPVPSRKRDAELWVLDKDGKNAPHALGEICYEGPAVSRKKLKIAWSWRGDKPDAVDYMAEIRYNEGIPELINRRAILTKENLPGILDIETQNFRPPDENELIFSAYGDEYRVCEVMGLDMETGEIKNYSRREDEYDEPEGIFPDGKHILVECDRHNNSGTGQIDIYKLKLDGSGDSERLTFFADRDGYKSSNPVISDDGRYMAFQVAKLGDWAGVGRGIFIYDLNAVKK
jgi:Tol biopolymer transport system component